MSICKCHRLGGRRVGAWGRELLGVLLVPAPRAAPRIAATSPLPNTRQLLLLALVAYKRQMSSPENPYRASHTDSVALPPATPRQQLLPVAIGLLVTSILHIAGFLYFCAYVYGTVSSEEMEGG